MTLLFERIGELDAGSDALTNLLNRRFLPTVLRREIELATRNQTPFSLLLLDLDHFKAINDGHGHDAGDRALQHVAGLPGQLFGLFGGGRPRDVGRDGRHFLLVFLAQEFTHLADAGGFARPLQTRHQYYGWRLRS
ncbi:diguanylate cyclase DosC [Salmonella enterica]|nr:diguanylate cyclase DosC [Salmonella enterica]